MSSSDLDERCFKILLVMALHKQQAHFNELERELKKAKMEFSRPTITVHLSHLIKAGYVTRKEETGTQFVTYSLNPEKIVKVKEIAERTKNIMKARKGTEEEFYELPEKEQIENVLMLELMRKLELIKAHVELGLDPNSLDKKVAVSFLESPLLRLAEHWVIKKSIEDANYRKKIFEIIDEWQKKANWGK
jgi:DNA-binding HxlR family transcriptional regulator